MARLLESIGKLLALYLNKEIHVHAAVPHHLPDQLLASLQPGDVLLVDGNRRISVAIKYLTQSTWSHAALFIGFGLHPDIPTDHCFVEADTLVGVRTVGIDEFSGMHTRICRPIGLSTDDCANVIRYALSHLGNQYDLRNVFDLARYLVATPPVPQAYRRRMLSLGSGDPTRAICSTLVAQAFQSIRYPILPLIEEQPMGSFHCPGCVRESFRIRHHSLFVPRDFDISPYFQIIKPRLDDSFDYRSLEWVSNSANIAGGGEQ